MEVKVKKLRENSKIPTKKSPSDAGYDIYVSTIEDLGNLVKIGFGISIEPAPGNWFMAVERSSTYKTGLSLSNKVGIIDQNYRGEIMGVFTKTELFKELPKEGDRLLQLIPQKIEQAIYIESDELSSTERGEGGFGSSGK